MTLSLSLGISIGVRRTLWMMLGELTGVALVAIAVLAGAATLLASAPGAFSLIKVLGAAYLIYCAVRAWRAPVALSFDGSGGQQSNVQLISQGFVASISNPKAWIFFAALLPPFINPDQAIVPQAALLLTAMLFIEFTCLLIYASGGRVMRDYLAKRGLGEWLNRIAASLMFAVAIWLLLS